jgi:Fic family protein
MFAGMSSQTADTLGLEVSHEALNLIAEVDEFKGKWEAVRAISPKRLRALRHVATIESIGSSTRIAGVKLTDREIEALLSNLDRHAFRSRDEEEVAGYAGAINLVFDSWDDLPLTENHIKQLHSVMLKFSTKDEHHRGQYKKLPNNVVAYDGEGKEIGVIFETTLPFQTPWEMEELVRWTNRALDEKIVHPILAVAAFIVCFLAITPSRTATAGSRAS